MTVEDGEVGGIKLEDMHKSAKSTHSIDKASEGDEVTNNESIEGKLSHLSRVSDDISSSINELNKQLEGIFHSSHGLDSSPRTSHSEKANPIATPQSKNDEEKGAAAVVVKEDLWRILLETKECRDRFLQELDNQRCLTSSITEAAFSSLRNAMKVSFLKLKLLPCFK